MTDAIRPRSFWEAVDLYPDKPAVIDEQGHGLTFRELAGSANQLSRLLIDLGATPGDTVLCVCGNTQDYVRVYVACLQIGCYFVPQGPKSAVDDLAWVLEDSAPVAVFAADNHTAVVDAVDRVGHADRRPAQLLGLKGRGLDESRLSERFVDADARATQFSADELDEPTAGSRLLYTGGTTGRPKGIKFPLPNGTPQDSAHRLVHLWAERLGMNQADGPHLVSGPLYHGLALMTASVALHLGNTLIMLKRWTPESWLSTVERHSVASTSMVPTMISRLLKEPTRLEYDPSSLRCLVHSGAPCPEPLKASLLSWLGEVVWEFYGASEAVGTAISSPEWRERPGSVGTPLPGSNVVVVDHEGRRLPAEASGEILIKGAGGKAEFTGASSVRGGFAEWPDHVSAGDIGHMDAEGYLYITDRVVDIIISGGVNVYSARVEAVLNRHADVALAAVVGKPDPDWGERVVAYVQPLPAVPLDRLLLELEELAATHLAPAHRPKELHWVTEMPVTGVGKLDKRLLKARTASQS